METSSALAHASAAAKYEHTRKMHTTGILLAVALLSQQLCYYLLLFLANVFTLNAIEYVAL